MLLKGSAEPLVFYARRVLSLTRRAPRREADGREEVGVGRAGRSGQGGRHRRSEAV